MRKRIWSVWEPRRDSLEIFTLRRRNFTNMLEKQGDEVFEDGNTELSSHFSNEFTRSFRRSVTKSSTILSNDQVFHLFLFCFEHLPWTLSIPLLWHTQYKTKNNINLSLRFLLSSLPILFISTAPFSVQFPQNLGRAFLPLLCFGKQFCTSLLLLFRGCICVSVMYAITHEFH